jgi:suppressor for copper-sensitivity B
MEQLGHQSGSIPFYAIFPAGRPNQPILLDGVFTSPKPFLKAFEEAGSSRPAGEPLAKSESR